MKFEMELHPNFVSDIVVKQLQEMYEHTKEAYFGSDPEEARAAIAFVLDYFMPPSDYEQWRADNVLDRNLAEEVAEGFDHLEKEREWVGLTDNERIALEDYFEIIIGDAPFDAIEAKLKEKNT